MGHRIFTVSIASTSRLLILRDRLRGLPKRITEDTGLPASILRVSIPSGRNLLDAVLVQPINRPARAAVLICHGIGETVKHWETAQRMLAQNDVASLIFNYSGYGKSTGSIDAEQCERDAIEAFRSLQSRTLMKSISLLGFSLGSGIATAVVGKVAARHLILCAAFTSLQEAACSIGVPRRLARILPAIWNTEDALRTCAASVLIVHGEGDRLFPARMARANANACQEPCELILVPGLSHNAPIFNPELSYWSLIAERLIREQALADAT